MLVGYLLLVTGYWLLVACAGGFIYPPAVGIHYLHPLSSFYCQVPRTWHDVSRLSRTL
jgi:hypothetical protein